MEWIADNRAWVIPTGLTAIALVARAVQGLLRRRATRGPKVRPSSGRSVAKRLLWETSRSPIWDAPPTMLRSARRVLLAHHQDLHLIGCSPLTPGAALERPRLVFLPDLVARVPFFDAQRVGVFGQATAIQVLTPVNENTVHWVLQLISRVPPRCRAYVRLSAPPDAFSQPRSSDVVLVTGYVIAAGNFRMQPGGAEPGVYLVADKVAFCPPDPDSQRRLVVESGLRIADSDVARMQAVINSQQGNVS